MSIALIFCYILVERLAGISVLLVQSFKQKGLAEPPCEITDDIKDLRTILAVLHHAATTTVPFDEAVRTFGIGIDGIPSYQQMESVMINFQSTVITYPRIYEVLVIALIGRRYLMADSDCPFRCKTELTRTLTLHHHIKVA